ncbi:MAG: glycine cleavage system protein GcvH [Candidatus Orphnella occulta]|nr:glycine cleavage system protein GcvH [Candidatus Orphnella occulta]
MNIPDGLLYTKEHEWVKIEGDIAIMGITDYAQSSLGDITFVELPEKGTEVEQANMLATIESVKAASDVYAPLSGSINRINQDIIDSPELVNQSPYEKGWFVAINIKNEDEKGRLMSASDYKGYVGGLA